MGSFLAELLCWLLGCCAPAPAYERIYPWAAKLDPRQHTGTDPKQQQHEITLIPGTHM